jgi:multidrug efflux pump subunit AcrA (membrane-fusion protein)
VLIKLSAILRVKDKKLTIIVKTRQIVILLSGVLLLILGFVISGFFASSKKDRTRPQQKTKKTAYVKSFSPNDVSVDIIESGTLSAKHKVVLFTEVQGILKPQSKEFRPGVRFKKGEVILDLENDEERANLASQKSNLQNLIASILPDLRLDYPESFDVWEAYLSEFSVEKPIAPLPEPKSDKEKYFITGRNIYTTYYSVLNLQTQLDNFQIRAPYDGIVTEALVTAGALVRPGQRVGEFINPRAYELAVSINASLMEGISIGEPVVLRSLDGKKSWDAKVSRLNAKIDNQTQTITCYMDVNASDLRDGMFLQATIPGSVFKNSERIDRKLLVQNRSVYIVKEGKLDLVPINIEFFEENTVVISGLEKGQIMLSRAMADAYPGMEVETQME